MSGTDTGRRDKRGESDNFCNRARVWLFVYPRHSQRKGSIYIYYYILVLFKVIFITGRGSHCKRNRERETERKLSFAETIYIRSNWLVLLQSSSKEQ